jgi:hypothetical protein
MPLLCTCYLAANFSEQTIRNYNPTAGEVRDVEALLLTSIARTDQTCNLRSIKPIRDSTNCDSPQDFGASKRACRLPQKHRKLSRRAMASEWTRKRDEASGNHDAVDRPVLPGEAHSLSENDSTSRKQARRLIGFSKTHVSALPQIQHVSSGIRELGWEYALGGSWSGLGETAVRLPSCRQPLDSE